MQVRQRLAVVTALVLGAALLTPTAPGTAATTDPATQRTISQIQALSKAKLARTATERKVDSRLLAEIAMRAGVPVAPGITKVRTGVTVSAGSVTVDVHGSLTNTVLNRLRTTGGSVQKSQTNGGTARVTLPLDQVLATAALPQVTHIAPAAGYITASMTGPGPQATLAPASRQQRQATVSRELKAALSRPGVTPQALPGGRGSVVSEAVQVEAVDKARTRFGVSGVGITVAVLSNGVDSLATSQRTGDLPPDVAVLPGQEGSGDEGTAMLELVHDIAPGAHLAFATVDPDPETFAANIRGLRAAGADIIVDDVIYFNESPFQDGTVAQAVNDVTADGALYFSSAGNEGNKDDGTSGTWEGDFVSSGLSLGKLAGTMHDFAPGPGIQTRDPVSDLSLGAPVDLFWSDPLGGATSDYDVYIVDETGAVVDFSNDIQNGTQDPYELTFVPSFTTHDGQQFSIVVVKFAGADRFLHLDALRGRFVDQPGLTGYSTSGELRGHAATANAFATAAAPAAQPLPFDLEPGDPPNPSGPFPGVFTGSQQSERFSSDGPRRVFFNQDGTPITPGNFSSTGGALRQKPEVTAADGVSTSLGGFTPFFGTSAAAPNAAAITALMLSGNRGMAPSTVRASITASALDIQAPGTDRDTGAGILMANRLLSLTGVAALHPYVVATNVVMGTTTDGDQFLEPGETGALNVAVTNTGDTGARQVQVGLSSSTPGVTITPTSRAYAWVGKNATKLSPRAWTISLSPTYPVGQPVELATTVSFADVLSPTSAALSLATGEPTPVRDFAYTGPAVAIPDDDATGATVPISVSGIGIISKATFSVDGTACNTDVASTTVGIDHTFVADLVGTLTSPSGTSIAVFSGDGGGGHNICQAVFDDSAVSSIDDAVSGDAPFTGSWRPTEPLSSFLRENADGTWEFSVVDQAAVDTGSIRSVSLHLSGFVSGT